MTRAGIQVSSVRPFLQTVEDVRASFQKFADMGCRIVQLQWMSYEIPPEEIAAAVKDAGLVSVSTQDHYDIVIKNPDYFIKLNQLCGSTHLCVGGIPDRFRSAEGCRAYAKELTALAKELDKKGLVLSLHPRYMEYDRFDGVADTSVADTSIPGIRILLENTPKEVCLGLDVYHVRRAGFDAAEWIEEFAGRIDFLHFKDCTHLPDGSEILTPVGQGETDWPPIVAACQKADIPWVFAEQERWQKDAFVCMKESFDWLLSQNFMP